MDVKNTARGLQDVSPGFFIAHKTLYHHIDHATRLLQGEMFRDQCASSRRQHPTVLYHYLCHETSRRVLPGIARRTNTLEKRKPLPWIVLYIIREDGSFALYFIATDAPPAVGSILHKQQAIPQGGVTGGHCAAVSSGHKKTGYSSGFFKIWLPGPGSNQRPND